MWKGKPIGDGTPFEAERALKPCEFNSRSFRLAIDELCHWPSGKGTGLPIRSGRFDSYMALFFEYVPTGVGQW